MMATRTRSSEGCWTCRLRRKKCDETRPTCRTCDALEIDCLYSYEKPEWMDNGQKQKDRAEWLKQEIKTKAGTRRDRKYVTGTSSHVGDVGGVETLVFSPPVQPQTQTRPSPSPRDFSASSGSEMDLDPSFASSPAPVSTTGTTPNSSSSVGQTLSHNPAASGASVTAWQHLQDNEVNLMMMYLDFVFPFLYPFYRPPIMDSGRGWLLVLLSRNKTLLHVALSLAANFFNVVLRHTSGPDHMCTTHTWEGMQKQQDLALKELQGETHNIVTRGVKGHLVETNRLMASIVQLLTFEVTIASNQQGWMMHLDAATELCSEIIKHHAMVEENDTVCFARLLIQLYPLPCSSLEHGRPWSSDQAALRFSTASLLLFDTLAATTLEQAPRLQWLHLYLLRTPAEWETQEGVDRKFQLPHINLRDFVGLHNWVVLAIGDIAALDAWKKEAKRNGSLSMMQLVTRASVIEQDLRKNMLALDHSCTQPLPRRRDHDIAPLLRSSHQMSSPEEMDHIATQQTRIWAQAAVTYLQVAVSGWQPASAEIRSSVTKTIELFREMPTSSCLRTCVWPFAVTGCLAQGPEEEETFRDMVAAMGPLQVFGTIRQALACMEYVWENRGKIGQDWDFAACARATGVASLFA